MNFKLLKEHSKDYLGEGTSKEEIQKFEELLNIKLPQEFYKYLLEIGYAEIYGDEIYSIYEIPDNIACKGLHWMNHNNQLLKEGFLEFFSNDIDGTFYLELNSGKVYRNSNNELFSNSFSEFTNSLINQSN